MLLSEEMHILVFGRILPAILDPAAERAKINSRRIIVHLITVFSNATPAIHGVKILPAEAIQISKVTFKQHQNI